MVMQRFTTALERLYRALWGLAEARTTRASVVLWTLPTDHKYLIARATR